MGKIISATKAAKLINVSRRTVARRVQENRLEGVLTENGYDIPRIDAAVLGHQEAVYSEHDKLKFVVYSHIITGVDQEQIAHRFVDDDMTLMRIVFNEYDKERSRQMRGYGIHSVDASGLVRGSEVMARLGVTDVRIPNKMLDSGLVSEYLGYSENNNMRPYCTLASFTSYLGNHSSEILYNSREGAKIIGVERLKINRFVNNHNKKGKEDPIGFKILDTKRSEYRFSYGDLMRIREAKR